MNYGAIKYYDIANGIGVRTSLFVSGCRRLCPGCFNAEAQDFSFGRPFERDVEDEIIESLKLPYIAGLSLLGGDPMEPENQQVLADFIDRVIYEVPDKNIWCYTGYVYDKDLQPGGSQWIAGVTDRILDAIDVLVDGPFVAAKKDITLRFRGSANQRVIDLAKTRAGSGELVPWVDDPVFATHSM